VNVIQAHSSSVTALAINQTGDLLCTSSEKGTIIRVYSLPNGEKSWSFRRGAYPAFVYSLAFSLDSCFISVTSDTGTIHIFRLDSATANTQGQGGIMSSYLPEVITKAWEPQRDFAHIKLPKTGIPALVGFASLTDEQTRVMVLTGDGFYYQYAMDNRDGGEPKLISENLLLAEEREEMSGAKIL